MQPKPAFRPLYKCDRPVPPLLYGATVSGFVTQAVKDNEPRGLRRSLVDALAHPKRVGLVGVTVPYQQQRVAAREPRPS